MGEVLEGLAEILRDNGYSVKKIQNDLPRLKDLRKYLSVRADNVISELYDDDEVDKLISDMKSGEILKYNGFGKKSYIEMKEILMDELGIKANYKGQYKKYM